MLLAPQAEGRSRASRLAQVSKAAGLSGQSVLGLIQNTQAERRMILASSTLMAVTRRLGASTLQTTQANHSSSIAASVTSSRRARTRRWGRQVSLNWSTGLTK